jgi:hypothetical protein
MHSNTVFRTDRDPNLVRTDRRPAPVRRTPVDPKVIQGQAIVARNDMLRRGHRVPADVDPHFIVGLHAAAVRDGLLGKPDLLRGVEIPRVAQARADFGPGMGSEASGDEQGEDPRAAGFKQLASRFKPSSRGMRTGEDASRSSNKPASRDPFASVTFSEANKSVPSTPAEATVRSRLAFGGSNEGFEGGGFALQPMQGLDSYEDSAATTAAYDSMVSRARDAWRGKR